MLFFDIGANEGRWALANASCFPDAQIVSVEADPDTFEKLKAAVAGEPRIVALQALVSSATEDVDFYVCSASTLNSTRPEWLTAETSRFFGSFKYHAKLKLKPTSLDALVREHGTPQMIKIDVETAELDVIESLTAAEGIRCIAFEWAAECGGDAGLCVDALVARGFRCFHLQHGDAYTYRPLVYELSAAAVKALVSAAAAKVDWGMVWASRSSDGSV